MRQLRLGTAIISVWQVERIFFLFLFLFFLFFKQMMGLAVADDLFDEPRPALIQDGRLSDLIRSSVNIQQSSK